MRPPARPAPTTDHRRGAHEFRGPLDDGPGQVGAAGLLRLADPGGAVDLEDPGSPGRVEHVDRADLEPDHARGRHRGPLGVAVEHRRLEAGSVPEVAREPPDTGTAAQGRDRAPPHHEGAQVAAPASPDVLLHHGVLAEPQDGLERRLERLPGLADDDARPLVPAEQLHEHREPADVPDHLPQPGRLGGHDRARDLDAARREQLQHPHLVAGQADGRGPVQDRQPEELQVVHHRQPVLAHRRRDAGDDHVRDREGATAVEDLGPVAPQAQLDLERIDDARHVSAGPRRLDDSPGGEDARRAGEDRDVHRGDGKGAWRANARGIATEEREGGRSRESGDVPLRCSERVRVPVLAPAEAGAVTPA